MWMEPSVGPSAQSHIVLRSANNKLFVDESVPLEERIAIVYVKHE